MVAAQAWLQYLHHSLPLQGRRRRHSAEQGQVRLYRALNRTMIFARSVLRATVESVCSLWLIFHFIFLCDSLSFLSRFQITFVVLICAGAEQTDRQTSDRLSNKNILFSEYQVLRFGFLYALQMAAIMWGSDKRG